MMKVKYETKRKIAGWIFILPWVIGTLFFFIQPLIQTIEFSLKNVGINPNGGGLLIQSIKTGIFQNYINAFVKDPDFMWYFSNALTSMLYSIPIIIIFSMFIANILAKKFVGRTFMRALFFLPVIITTGIVIEMIQNSLSSVQMGGSTNNGNLFNSARLIDFLLNSGMPKMIVDYISASVSNLVGLIWKSGVQILVFMAGILSIPQSYYEVSSVEGATSWESFWKITFPLIIPHMMINIIYTMVDMLSSYDNDLMRYIINTIYSKIQFSYGSALSWLYFTVVLTFIGALFLLINLLSRKRLG